MQDSKKKSTSARLLKFLKVLKRKSKKTLKKMKIKPVLAFTSALFAALIKKPIKKMASVCSSSWRVLIVIIPLFLLIYYPIGGLLINNTTKRLDAEIKPTTALESNTINMIAFIIDDEVNQKLWTPNLPFFFPSYFLNNMPSMQLGIISTLGNFSSAFAQLSGHQTTIKDQPLSEVAKRLNTPGTVWLFSPDSTLSTAPSANSQYRHARKLLISYNKSLIAGTSAFQKNYPDLILLLRKINQDISSNTQNLEKFIREESPYFFGTRPSRPFFFHQGKIYAYFMILRALSHDYKEIIVTNNLYPIWTQMLKSLEEGSRLSPMIVRNGDLNSLTAPNHLAHLALFSLSAQKHMKDIILTLEEKSAANAN